MYPTPTLWFEIGVAILLGFVFLWTKPEYGLFLYAFALGFPDFAYPLGTTINMRLDDVLIVLFLARTILWTPAPLSRRAEKNIRLASDFPCGLLIVDRRGNSAGNAARGL